MLEGYFNALPCETVNSVIGEVSILINTLDIHTTVTSRVFHSCVLSIPNVGKLFGFFSAVPDPGSSRLAKQEEPASSLNCLAPWQAKYNGLNLAGTHWTKGLACDSNVDNEKAHAKMPNR